MCAAEWGNLSESGTVDNPCLLKLSFLGLHVQILSCLPFGLSVLYFTVNFWNMTVPTLQSPPALFYILFLGNFILLASITKNAHYVFGSRENMKKNTNHTYSNPPLHDELY